MPTNRDPASDKPETDSAQSPLPPTSRVSRIVGNLANAAGVADKEGGGGVAARNSHVYLKICGFTTNEAAGFAGGAVYFVSCWEGGFGATGFLANERAQFDEIMDHVHGFQT